MNAKAESLQASISKTAPVGLRPGTILAGLAVVLFATWWIFRGLADEPHFADESAMIAQSYYYTLFKSGRWNHPDWLHYAAFDHPPLPKYFFGLSLELAGKRVPQSIEWWMNWSGYVWENGQWVRSKGGDFRPPEDPGVLYWARVPAAVFGVGGVLAAFFVGLQMRGRLVGILAAMLLLANPLYFTHARRAMSDSFAECLVIGSVAVGLWGGRELWAAKFCRWRWVVFMVAEAVLCGLAALAKLNGGVAAVMALGLIVSGWLLATWGRLRAVHGQSVERPNGRNLLAGPVVAAAIGAGSFGVFLGLNPFLTARPKLSPEAPAELLELRAKSPIARAKFLVEFRRDWSRNAMQDTQFEKDWLLTPGERLRMTMWEGFGRFSVLGPRDLRTIAVENFESFDRDHDGKLSRDELPAWIRPQIPRIDVNRDGFLDQAEVATILERIPQLSQYHRRNGLVWLPLCVLGLAWAVRDGWLQFQSGRIPQPWALVWYTAVIAAVVVLLIPLNWDRYYLPLQACSALLVPYGIAATLNWMGSRLVLRPAQAQRT